MNIKSLICLAVILMTVSVSNAEDIANFDDLSLEPNSYWNGSDGSGGFISGQAWFNNNYDSTWGSWDSFCYSNMTDINSSGWAAQYNAITGAGEDGSANYAVGYVGWAGPPTIVLDEAGVVDGLYVTNNNFAYYSMKNGDAFSKKFGGDNGGDADWFLLTITGLNANNEITGSVDFYLADFRFEDNNSDYIVDTWDYVELSSLGQVKSMEFTLNSSDTGAWGMNTPAYFVIDSILEPLSPLMQAMQDIDEAIESKLEAEEAIKAALAKERSAINALNLLLQSGNLEGLTVAEINEAKAKVKTAISSQRIAKHALNKSIDRLEDMLVILTGDMEK